MSVEVFATDLLTIGNAQFGSKLLMADTAELVLVDFPSFEPAFPHFAVHCVGGLRDVGPVGSRINKVVYF